MTTDQYLEAAAKAIAAKIVMTQWVDGMTALEVREVSALLGNAAVEAWVGDREPLYTIGDLNGLGPVVIDGVTSHPWAAEVLDKMVASGVLVRVSVEGNEHESE